VTGLTDNGGNLVATYSYDAFGNIISENGDATLNALNPYRFTSRVWDKESGLYYYRARYYDSKTGRFTQKDPLRSELTEGKNLYVYCENNPVNMVDPEGLYTFEYFRYKQWYWWWGWKYKWIYYGWKLKLSNKETIDIAAIIAAGSGIAFAIPDPTISKVVAVLLWAEATLLGSCAWLGKGAVFYCYHLTSFCPLPCGPGTATVSYQWCE
jgi:RHS repeat-associated protein